MKMTQQVLILGGSGRIGRQVAADLLTYTLANITLAGRNGRIGMGVAQALLNEAGATASHRCQFLSVALDDQPALRAAIAESDLVIHCAGPFHRRNATVLNLCIELGVNYIDVSDHPSFTCKAIALRAKSEAAGITAIVNTGIFPGISNSMVRRDIEQLDHAHEVHLSYVVGGSGGAGRTVMQSTFLGLQRPFEAWIKGQRQLIQPYRDRELLSFPHFGRVGVYWFDMPESFTLADTFPVKTVVTKFGSVPRFYSYLTWSVARWCPSRWLRSNAVIEFLSQVSYAMTEFSNRFSGVGVAIRSDVTGLKHGQKIRCRSTLFHPDTAEAAGMGTGTIAELILAGDLNKPGVWAPEQALKTSLFEAAMQKRGIEIYQQLLPDAIHPFSKSPSVIG
ncbi:saccharopine dehydrogenase family protein [Leptolyngbya ohadii]|uniref:saccharopine dehydrogenase family protein n=1 Tax=Leptolyngbya ohadii TaxID=1962290 RepID=UPI0021F1F412|nr:saccharopine dehydrogenase NADP-binding domain-containing protein [Leptolyngbya ohadii]